MLVIVTITSVSNDTMRISQECNKSVMKLFCQNSSFGAPRRRDNKETYVRVSHHYVQIFAYLRIRKFWFGA